MSKQMKLEEISSTESFSIRSPRVLAKKGSIPTEWEFKSASSITDIKTGHTPSRENPEYWDGDIPWIAIHDLTETNTAEIHETSESITQEGLKNSGAKLLPSGTFVLCRTGSIGASAILGREMATDQSTVSFECIDDVSNPYYLKYIFSNCQPELDRLGIGSTHPSIQLDFFPDLQIPTPPIEEQRKIATVLYTVDQLIEKTENIIDQTQTVKRGLMQDVFHGRHKDFNEYHRTPVGEIPAHWSVASIGDVVHTAQYGISESLSEEGQYPIFRMNNIKNGKMVDEPLKYIDLDDDEFDKYRVEEGDILFNRTNSLKLVGKTGIYELEGDHVFASYLVRLKTNDEANPYYLNYYMNSSEAQNRMMDFATKGVSQANINANSIQQVTLPLPPLEEQREIADRLSRIDSQIEANEQYKCQLKRLKRGLMQDLLSGKVRTTDTNIEVPEEISQHG